MRVVRRVSRRQVAGLAMAELLIVGAAVAYGVAVVARHALPPTIVYGCFVAVACLMAAVLWYVFVVWRPLWWGRRATPARLAAVVAASAIVAVALEWGTLVGAPLSSPWVLGDWHVSRMAAFLVLALPVVACVVMYDWRAWGHRLANAALTNNKAQLKRLCAWTLAAAVVAAVAAWAAGVACGVAGLANAAPYQGSAAVVAATVVVLAGLHRSMAERPERGLFVMVLAAGLLLTTLVPLYTHVSWDDHIHYDRAVATSYLLDPEYTAADASLIVRAYHDVAYYARYPGCEGWVDPYDATHLKELYDGIDGLRDATSYDPPDEFDDQRGWAASTTDASWPVRLSGATTLRGVSIVEYYTVAYVPAAMGLWVARLLALPATVAFLLGRMLTLLCYAAVVYFACKRLRSGKMILAACALVPTAMFLASGYSYDSWLMAFTMLGFACFVGELQRPDEPLQWRWFLLMVAAFLVGLGPKAIYVPVAAMLLFMPRAKFARAAVTPELEASKVAAPRAKASSGSLTHGRYLVVVFASALFVLFTFVLPFFVAGPGSGDVRGGEVNPPQQMAFIVQQPLAYLGIFGEFLKDYLAFDKVEFALTDFCGIETASFASLVALLLPAVALTDRRLCDVALATHAKRLCMAALALLVIFLAATSLFITFTPGGATSIAGVQGRYLLPLLFPVFMVCLCFRPLARWGEGLNRLAYHYGVLALSGILLFASIAEVLVFHF